jgi:hypothetical protein
MLAPVECRIAVVTALGQMPLRAKRFGVVGQLATSGPWLRNIIRRDWTIDSAIRMGEYVTSVGTRRSKLSARNTEMSFYHNFVQASVSTLS